jgi:hypothetical protein
MPADDFDFDTPADDFDSTPPVIVPPAVTPEPKGENVGKLRLVRILGISRNSIDRYIQQGAAGIVQRGSKSGE